MELSTDHPDLQSFFDGGALLHPSIDYEFDAMTQIFVITDVSECDTVPMNGLVGSSVPTDTPFGQLHEDCVFSSDHPTVSKYAALFERLEIDGPHASWRLRVFTGKKHSCGSSCMERCEYCNGVVCYFSTVACDNCDEYRNVEICLLCAEINWTETDKGWKCTDCD